jgi:hypothetical protein
VVALLVATEALPSGLAALSAPTSVPRGALESPTAPLAVLFAASEAGLKPSRASRRHFEHHRNRRIA